MQGIKLQKLIKFFLHTLRVTRYACSLSKTFRKNLISSKCVANMYYVACSEDCESESLFQNFLLFYFVCHQLEAYAVFVANPLVTEYLGASLLAIRSL